MHPIPSLEPLLPAQVRAEEHTQVAALAAGIGIDATGRSRVQRRATALVRRVRETGQPTLMERFLVEYGLSTAEGVALMTLAEAMLRVPDVPTTDALVADKVANADWDAHAGRSASPLVNASTWALALTRRMLADDDGGAHRLVKRMGEPVVRRAIEQAMRELGRQFVLGRDINEAVERAARLESRGYAYSYDMLGEAARTEADAQRYGDAYAGAIAAIAARAAGEEALVAGKDAIAANPGISVKLSALHPRYETLAHARVTAELTPRLERLAQAARAANIGFNVDAEESERLELSLHVIERVLANPQLGDWNGFGVVVQSYSRRAMDVVRWLIDLASQHRRRIMVRLVKGAYWDTEIKRAQVLGVRRYPVFTRKSHTDVSYLACANALLQNTRYIYPQFATHNAHTTQAVLAIARSLSIDTSRAFEFQRLHGMGEALHDALRATHGTRCRIYAPVGPHRDLLAYLVRRLLENGANSSFVNQIADADIPAEHVARDPLEAASKPRAPSFPVPPDLYGATRRNARGWDPYDPATLASLSGSATSARTRTWQARPMLAGAAATAHGPVTPVRNPADTHDQVGEVAVATRAQVQAAVAAAPVGGARWAAQGVAARADVLRRAADLYEQHAAELFSLAEREAGKTLNDQIGELREAVDFLRYYASESERVGDGCAARGIIACISPWNFPLAIFTGQIAAALGAGNAVLAKPAEQTPLIAARAVSLLHEAGVPEDALQLLPGDGPEVGAALTSDPRIDGVCFTGSTATASAIDRAMAANASPYAMFIAETGGLNAMIVDSTALLEQAVRDIVASSFQSAGQRCSALRMLYVQSDVSDALIRMLRGAMRELEVRAPSVYSADVGPLIDAEARDNVLAHVDAWAQRGRVLERLPVPATGHFASPTLIQVDGIADLEEEVFGPVLHVASFEAESLDAVIDAINAKGYGLTFGLHTRLGDRADYVAGRVHAGNVYINRNQIGAVVGTQPFGGEGLSGTGPKAGGPGYLTRFRRDGGKTTGRFTGTVVDARTLVANLERLDAASWGALDHAARAQRLSGAAADALAQAHADRLEMPGPTGERNTLRRVPRGVALCLGPGARAAREQAVSALACGNASLVVADGARVACAALVGSELPLHVLDGQIELEALRSAMPLDMVLCCADEAVGRSVREQLAARGSPFIPLISDANDLDRMVIERHVCIDTTAAGGNASLLAGRNER